MYGWARRRPAADGAKLLKSRSRRLIWRRSLISWAFASRRPPDLREALTTAFAHDGPALVDVVTHHDELVMPPKINLGQVTGFSLWTAKVVLSGRGTEVIDLAKSNLLR